MYSYIVGSIPTGYLFAKLIAGIDITKHGSKNIGATNVARVLNNKNYFFIIFLTDFLKTILGLGIIIYTLAYFFPPTIVTNIAVLCSIIMLIGNSFSIFIHFKGGKGVATTLGIIIFFFPYILFFITLFLWIFILYFSKKAFISSLISIYTSTIIYALLFFQGYTETFFLIFLSAWLTFRHKDNIIFFNKRKKQ